MKIMSSCSQACALATPTSALRSPRTPAITAPAVTAKYALTMILTTAGGDRSIVSRCRSFSTVRYGGVPRVEPADRQREAPPPPHWISSPRSPETVMPAIFESRSVAMTERGGSR